MPSFPGGSFVFHICVFSGSFPVFPIASRQEGCLPLKKKWEVARGVQRGWAAGGMEGEARFIRLVRTERPEDEGVDSQATKVSQYSINCASFWLALEQGKARKQVLVPRTYLSLSYRRSSSGNSGSYSLPRKRRGLRSTSFPCA